MLPLVVALPDGDDEALLRFAAWEALVHGCAVHLVHASPDGPSARTSTVIESAIARTEVLAGPGVMVTGTVITGPPVAAVLDDSRACLGVAVRQRDSLHLMRAIGEHCRPGTDPPVACVPSGWAPVPDDTRPVLVGVDDPVSSRGLLRHALEVAHAHETSLLVLHSWRFPRRYDVRLDERIGEVWSDQVRDALGSVLAACSAEAGSEVPIDVVVEPGVPADGLVGAATSAQCLMLERNHPGSGPEHVGRTTRAALHQCPCPIVLLPPPRP